MPHLSTSALDLTTHATGIIIPVYLPQNESYKLGSSLLEDTTRSFAEIVENPAFICLVVDGDENGRGITKNLHTSEGITAHGEGTNRGKLQGMISGARLMLLNKDIKYLAVIDQDGDHFANELVNLVRMAEHITTQTGNDRVLVNGSRSSRHRPLGFLRGELEELADRVLLDMLHYRAVSRNRPLNLQFCMPLAEFPDFHSGYKLYSRPIAEAVFGSEPSLSGCSENACYRHACEAVTVVECLENGATLGEITRSTFNEQPVSSFGKLDRIQLGADKIIWPAKRLEIPPQFIRQWLMNHMSRLMLPTLSPQGKDEFARIVGTVMETLDPSAQDHPSATWGPLFV